MMILGDLGSASGLVFILITMFSGINSLWSVYIGVAISSVFLALQNPAYKASMTDLLDEESYSKASGLVQLSESSKFLISPIVVGILLNIMDIKYILVIDISTFLIAIIAVFWVKKNFEKAKPKKEKENFLSDLKYVFYRLKNAWYKPDHFRYRNAHL
jgi:MFS transporter, DHA3 family, macrolide efflux protein